MTSAAFVVSTGRCGSSLVSRALALNPRLLSLSEYFTALGGAPRTTDRRLTGHDFWNQVSTPSPDLVAFLRASSAVPELADIEWRSEHRSNPLWIPLRLLTARAAELMPDLRDEVVRAPEESPHEHHHRVFTWLTKRLARPVWVERSGGSLQYVDHLIRAWPKAKFVHLARSGVDCASSMARHPFFRIRIARAVARDPDLSVEQCLSTSLRADRFGALWSAEMLRAERCLAALDSRLVLSMRYEDLIRSPQAELLRLGQFLDPEADHTAWALSAAQLVQQPVGRALEPTPELTRACRPGMRVYARLNREPRVS